MRNIRRNLLGISLSEMCPNTELFLVRIFLYSNTGKYRPEITPYLDNFPAAYQELRKALLNKTVNNNK